MAMLCLGYRQMQIKPRHPATPALRVLPSLAEPPKLNRTWTFHGSVVALLGASFAAIAILPARARTAKGRIRATDT